MDRSKLDGDSLLQPIDKQRPPFDTVLSRGLERQRAPGGADCPDDAMLAAYCERSLFAPELAHCEEHFSNCARCQRVLAAIARAQAAADAAPSRTTWRRWQPYAALAAGVAGISIAVGLMITERHQSGRGDLAAHIEVSRPEQLAKQASSAMKRSGPQIALNESASRANPAAIAPSYAPSTEDQPNPVAPKVPGPSAPQQRALTESKPASTEGNIGIPPPKVSIRAPAIMIAGAPPEAPPPASSWAINKPECCAPAARNAPSGPVGRRSVQAHAAGAVSSGAGMMAGFGGVSERPTLPLVSIRTADNVERWRLVAGSAIQHLGSDGGWHRQYRALHGALTAGAAPSPRVCWVVGTGGTILRTTDGEHWQTLHSPTSENLVAISASSASSALVTADDGRHFATDDGGHTWQPM